MMPVHFFESIEGNSVDLNPEVITMDKNDEVEDEEQQEGTLKSPSVVNIGIHTQAMSAEDTCIVPCFINGNELFGMSSLDEVSYRVIQANLKAHGLGTKVKQEEVIARLSMAAKKCYMEKWKKVVRDKVNEENDTDDSICETNHKDCNNGNDSNGSSLAGFESPNKDKDDEDDKSKNESPEEATPAKTARGDISDDALSMPPMPPSI
jgi:hypothetical protein